MELEIAKDLTSLMWIMTGLILLYIRIEHTKNKTMWWISLVWFIYFFLMGMRFTMDNFSVA